MNKKQFESELNTLARDEILWIYKIKNPDPGLVKNMVSIIKKWPLIQMIIRGIDEEVSAK